MTLFGGVIPVTGITFLLFCVFAIAFTLGFAVKVSPYTTNPVIDTLPLNSFLIV